MFYFLILSNFFTLDLDSSIYTISWYPYTESTFNAYFMI